MHERRPPNLRGSTPNAYVWMLLSYGSSPSNTNSMLRYEMLWAGSNPNALAYKTYLGNPTAFCNTNLLCSFICGRSLLSAKAAVLLLLHICSKYGCRIRMITLACKSKTFACFGVIEIVVKEKGQKPYGYDADLEGSSEPSCSSNYHNKSWKSIWLIQEPWWLGFLQYLLCEEDTQWKVQITPMWG